MCSACSLLGVLTSALCCTVSFFLLCFNKASSTRCCQTTFPIRNHIRAARPRMCACPSIFLHGDCLDRCKLSQNGFLQARTCSDDELQACSVPQETRSADSARPRWKTSYSMQVILPPIVAMMTESNTSRGVRATADIDTPATGCI